MVYKLGPRPWGPSDSEDSQCNSSKRQRGVQLCPAHVEASFDWWSANLQCLRNGEVGTDRVLYDNWSYKVVCWKHALYFSTINIPVYLFMKITILLKQVIIVKSKMLEITVLCKVVQKI